MVNPQTILDGLSAELEAGTALSTVLTRQADLDGVDNRLATPFGELQFVSSVRSDEFNTDRVGWVTDGAGNRIGQLLQATFDPSLQLDIYTAAGDKTVNATTLGFDVQRYLRRFDDAEYDQPLPDSNGDPITDVESFSVGDGRREDDLVNRPGIRRWRQDLSLEFVDVIDTAAEYGEEDYVATVDSPSSGDMSSSEDSVVIEYEST